MPVEYSIAANVTKLRTQRAKNALAVGFDAHIIVNCILCPNKIVYEYILLI